MTAGQREHLKTWNQLTYDLGAITRDEHGRLRFQPFVPAESADLLQERFSVAATAVREFVEELYGVHELETGDGRVDPTAIYRRREASIKVSVWHHAPEW